MKESTKTEEVKIEVITKENLSNLSEGYFCVPTIEGQTEESQDTLICVSTGGFLVLSMESLGRSDRRRFPLHLEQKECNNSVFGLKNL